MDGFIESWPHLVGGFVATGLVTAATLPALVRASPARVAMVTSAFFVASLLSFPVGGTRVHLLLLGLAGVVLGRAAFPSVLVGLGLQLLMFGHGGYTTLGINALNMGLGALCAGLAFHLLPRSLRAWIRGGVAGFLGTLVGLLCYGATLLAAGEALRATAWAVIALHLPVLAIETVITAQAAAFLERVRPDLLGDSGGTPPAALSGAVAGPSGEAAP